MKMILKRYYVVEESEGWWLVVDRERRSKYVARGFLIEREAERYCTWLNGGNKLK
jgi:hypothetical protein